MDDDTSDDIRLYLVRVWREADQFRAAVRPPGDSAPRLFTEPARLAAFLARPRNEIDGGDDELDA